MRFQRYVSIDWAGAAKDAERVAIRVAAGTSGAPSLATLVPPPKARTDWRRDECFEYLKKMLRHGEPVTAVAMDFGFGFPWGSGTTLFGHKENDWVAFIRAVASEYAAQSKIPHNRVAGKNGPRDQVVATAELVARAINAKHPSEPFRMAADGKAKWVRLFSGVVEYQRHRSLDPLESRLRRGERVRDLPVLVA